MDSLPEQEDLVTIGAEEWLSLGEASAQLGVHPNTVRRWADAGTVPHYRTPGGHRRFRAADLRAWMASMAAVGPMTPDAGLATVVRDAVGYTRQQIAVHRISREAWHAAFAAEAEQQQMREMGRQMMGLAIEYLYRRHDLAPVLAEGRRVGQWYGERCAERGVSLADTARSFCFFRTSLLQATSSSWVRESGVDAEQVRAHTRLGAFLDEAMFACLAGYEAASHRLRPPESVA